MFGNLSLKDTIKTQILTLLATAARGSGPRRIPKTTVGGMSADMQETVGSKLDGSGSIHVNLYIRNRKYGEAYVNYSIRQGSAVVTDSEVDLDYTNDDTFLEAFEQAVREIVR